MTRRPGELKICCPKTDARHSPKSYDKLWNPDPSGSAQLWAIRMMWPGHDCEQKAMDGCASNAGLLYAVSALAADGQFRARFQPIRCG